MSPRSAPVDQLIEQSADLHVDAMRRTRESLADLVEIGRDRQASGIDPDEVTAWRVDRRRLLATTFKGMVAVTGTALAGGLFEAFTTSPAFAAATPDVAAAQTAASIENLAVAVYKKAAGLPFMANIPNPAGKTVVDFVTQTIQQHTDHAKAFNAAAQQLGGQAQTMPDPVVFDKVVTPALPGLKGPKDVVDFAATLEFVAAQTYAAETGSVSDKNLRNTFASIMGIENQHRAILLAVSALLGAGKPNLIMLGPPADQLPGAAGSVGFPDSFLKTDQARPADEGAVK